MNLSMKSLLMAGTMLVSSLAGMAAEGPIAFPGAEGFGKYATGGRGGSIYHVTTLADSGPGSLRDAVSQSNRIIVFDVCGVIKLESALVFKGKLTVLGQTAPGEGVQVYGDRVSFSGADNLIIRHMRFRMGKGGTSGKDACGVANGGNMIFDHISCLWGRDENFSINWDNKGTEPHDITIQNSIIGQGLQSHSCGGLMQTNGGVTLYRNLYIENKTRNPKVKGVNQFVNNIIYNWGNGAAYNFANSEGKSWGHIEGNYFMRGPWEGATKPFIGGYNQFYFYGVGNYYDDNLNGKLDGRLLTTEENNGGGSIPVESLAALNASVINGSSIPTAIPEVLNVMSAEDAYKWALDSVGASLPARDEVDQYLIDEMASYGVKGTTGGISDEKSLPHKGTGTLSSGPRPLDTDGDGIPDEWEIANGLDPNNASDAAAIAANGYANIENYANSLTTSLPYIKMPLNAKVSNVTKTSANLTWTANGNTENGFVIELSTDGGKNWVEKATAQAGATSVSLTDLTPTTAYSVRVYSTDGKGLNSDYSAVIAFETSGDPIAPGKSSKPSPADKAYQGTAIAFDFSWTNTLKTYTDANKYTLWLAEEGAELVKVAEGLTATTYSSADLATPIEAGKTYQWRVDATNPIGTTEGNVWTFTATAGGQLFYTDFCNYPQAWADSKYGPSNAANTDIFNGANKKVELAGMTMVSGANAMRLIAMNGANKSDDSTKDYGPYTADDAGASSRCIQFYTAATGSYIETPEVTGPCTLTLYIGNPDASSKTVKIWTITADGETSENFTVAAKKRIFKYTSVYTKTGPVKFRFDSNGKKINLNDILIERYEIPDANTPLALTEGQLVNENISYADGSISLTFNQPITFDGKISVDGAEQFEKFNVTAAGSKLILNYANLAALAEYVVSIPDGAIKNLAETQTYPCEIKISTVELSPEKQEGETHWGKAAKNLPLNFAPFNTKAPFETVGGLVQSESGDYPHWVTASGGIQADKASLSKTSDKVMAYWDGESRYMYVKLALTSGATGKVTIQETRNADASPYWRNIRTVETSEFPYEAELELNQDTRFVKIAVNSISGGNIEVQGLRISDDDGYFGPDYVFSAIEVIEADENAPVEYYNLQGIRVSDNPAPGLYIRRQGSKVSKVKL